MVRRRRNCTLTGPTSNRPGSRAPEIPQGKEEVENEVVDAIGEVNTLRWCKWCVVEQNGVEEERRELEGKVVRTNGERKI